MATKNAPKSISPTKSALVMFAAAFVLGLAIFLIFGQFAGVFSGEEGFVDALSGSAAGWVAVFGLTLMAAAPLIGITVWALDRAAKSIVEKK